jgi:hypothetical protein
VHFFWGVRGVDRTGVDLLRKADFLGELQSAPGLWQEFKRIHECR